MKKRNGFTLVELIAVIAILGMIMIIAVPKVYNSIVSNKKRTFIINAKNIVRQLEYDNLEFNTFTKIPLEDLGLKKISSKNIDLKNSVAYIVDDEIVLDLVGKSDYKDFYLCNLAYTNEDYIVQSTPCDKEHNFVYIDFVVDLDGGSTSQNFNTKYLSGNYLVLEIPKKPNDTFLGWELVSGNSILDQNRIKFGTENTRIKAIWGNNPELVVNLNGGTSSQKFDSKYSGGSLIILQEPTREGYKFKGWNLVVGNAILSGNVLTTGTTNTVIEAVWELSEFNISYELNGGTKGENAPSKGKGGSSLIISNPTKLGYTFKGWDVIGAGSSISGTILTMGSQDVILVANWEIDNYTISYNLNGGSVTGNPSNYTIETSTFTLNNPSKTGYTFKGWTGSNGSTANTSVSVPKGSTGDKTYTANYQVNTYSISYNLNGGTVSTANKTSYTVETSTFMLNNPSKTGYTFKGWTGSNGSTANTSVSIAKGSTGDKTYTANYTINTYTINYVLGGGTSGSSAPTSGTYGSTVTVSNPTRTGYEFTGWSVSGTGSVLSGTKLTIGSANVTLTANWRNTNPLSQYKCANSNKGSSPVFTYSGNCSVIDDGSGNWRVKFLNSGTIVFNANISIDVFLVGGGGGGGSGYRSDSNDGVYGSGGGGGGGGYTKTQKNISVTAGSSYTITIGAGGTATAGSAGSVGGETSGFDLFASGGKGGGKGTGFSSSGAGGAGGNRGGTGGYGDSSTGKGNAGGSYGSGATCEFGEGTSSGCTKGTAYAYSGGGGGGASVRDGNAYNGGTGGTGGGGTGGTGTTGGKSGTANTGGGGGGGSGRYTSGGAAGGSGVVVIRNKR